MVLSSCTTINKPQDKAHNLAFPVVHTDVHKTQLKLNLPSSCSYDSAYKYLVLKGDAIDKIAHRIDVSSKCIVAMNKLQDNKLSISQALRLPKQAFINSMLMKMCPINQRIMKSREFLLALSSENIIKGSDKTRLKQLAINYAVSSEAIDDHTLVEQLLLRVNIIPESLTLAQAILESNWGGSRFAVHGNNYFGLHCFTKGCGIAPRYPTAGVIDEVSKFPNTIAGIVDYYRVLNTLAPYAEFRRQRAQLSRLNGYDLTDYLQSYSGLKGDQYANILKTVMRDNDLQQYDGVCENF